MKEENLASKYKWCTLVLVITMTVLLIRLWDLQIMRGAEMRKLSEQNRIRVKKIVAPRGIIYDRMGKVLADTRPSFNIYLTPEDIRDFSQTVDGLVPAGWQTARWDGRADRGERVASGVYFCRLEAGSRELSRKVVVLK